MVSPTARRRAVKYLCERRKFSERRACCLIEQPRETNRYQGKERAGEQMLLKRLYGLSTRVPRYGYRRLTDKLREEGWRVNRKRVYRLCRREGIKVFPKQKRRQIRQKSEIFKAARKNEIWSYDFLFDQTTEGKTLKFLTVLDLFTREAHTIAVERRMTALQVTHILEELFSLHGAPAYLQSDNGAEFVAEVIKTFLAQRGTATQYIPPGAPWQNGHIESFHDKLRDECLNRELFLTLKEAKVVVEEWRNEYNSIRPHSALGRIPPAAFAARLSSNSGSKRVIHRAPSRAEHGLSSTSYG
jgi:putative transposase